MRPPYKATSQYDLARQEHTFLLRAEGLTLEQIGTKLGIGKEGVRQKILNFGNRTAWAARKAKFKWLTNNAAMN